MSHIEMRRAAYLDDLRYHVAPVEPVLDYQGGRV
jgi:hypothetical protein